MFRNQYDNDVTVWSPQGRLHQVEYAMEAVKLGSVTVGIKSETHACLAALRRAASGLSAYQDKVFEIDKHVCISISGLTADARVLSRFMRIECLNHKVTHGVPLPVGRLMLKLGNKMQICTQRYDKRPYGVGLLVAGYDETGTYIYQTCPSANYYDCKAMAIGSRSQSARTYLEKHLDEFMTCSVDELSLHALKAIQDTLPNDVQLSLENVQLGIVGNSTPYYEISGEKLQKLISMIEGEERRVPTPVPDTGIIPADEPPSSDAAPSSDDFPVVAMDVTEHQE